MKLKLLIVALFFSVLGWGQVTIFSENMYNGSGGASGNTIAAHETNNRFNEDGLTYSGTGDMRTSGPSSGYGTASGTWNVMMNATGETFVIDGINASAYTSLVLSFGVGKAANAPNGSTLIVEYSTTGSGGSFTAITWPLLPTGTGTSYATTYYYRSSTSVIPSNVTTIRFRTTTTDEFRVDDVLLEGVIASSNTITTDAFSGSYCVSVSTGASVSVPFTSVGTFNAGNDFIAHLSNASGVFPGTPIGTLSASGVNPSGTITATIPAGTTAGTGYRIRVVSSNPTVIGTDNGTNLTVQNSAAITAQPSTTVQNLCQGSAATALSVTATGTALTYQWYSNTTATNSGGTPVGTNSASYTPVTTATGTLYYYCVVSAACGASVTSNVSGAVNVTAIPSAPAGTINISANPSCGAATLT
ncbi:MAG: hypothetical protein LDL23_01110, partial [Flavobacterium sp.]|uniref:hypothetical protein n=1 Tax=Flavobacterium sp. TaxID=239 RepID=UPI0025C33634